MAPPAAAAASSFWRVVGLAENVPLFAMVGIACGFSVYSFTRSMSTATDIVCATTRRNFLEENMSHSPKLIEESNHYERGMLRFLSKIKDYPHVIPHVGAQN